MSTDPESAEPSLPDPKAIVIVFLDGPGRQKFVQCPAGTTKINVEGWTSISVHVAPFEAKDIGLEHG